MAKRTIVSYNDLYDEFGDDLIAAPASAPATVSAPGRVLSTITVSGGNDDSCTSESETEGQGVVGMNGDWDDSDLIRAWDSTISSYRRQHALLMEDESYRAEQHASESIIGQWSSVESGAGGKRKRRHEPPVKRHEPVVERQDLVAQEPAADVAGFTGFGLPTSEDDALSKLNMAWYYAGYYAGCYQERRDAGSPEPTVE
ncbi:hypothetical protein LPJ73_004885 [Coemansia sp. RSA 2703]|nr:hypothetical protein LPJ73_004885 [Coemansia sp. RSA 2703]